jgi:hypothetical protein
VSDLWKTSKIAPPKKLDLAQAARRSWIEKPKRQSTPSRTHLEQWSPLTLTLLLDLTNNAQILWPAEKI